MRTSKTLLLGLMLAGCASDPIELPDWDLARREPVEVIDPTELPLLCELPWDTVECMQAIEQYEIISEANTEIAQNNADALRATEGAYDAILSAGMAQQRYGRIKQEQLNVCRRDAESDKWFYRGSILAILGIAVAK